MARRSWLDRINPAKWLSNIVDAITPTPRHAPRTSSPRTAVSRETPRAVRGDDPFRQAWQDAGGQGSYRRERAFFDSIPGVGDDDDDLELWDSFLRYMTGDGDGYKFNDPGNPFWSAIGLSPRRGGGFNWDEWRRAVHGGQHRNTP